ncbi:MAG: Gfo/Idh/MocA family oxidoreductase [Verrucomicrobiota bacterium]
MTDFSETHITNPRPRVALIGVTGYGWMHFDEIRKRVERGHGTFAGATVINPGDAPEQMDWFRQHEVPVFGDYTAMLERLDGALDLCCIPTAISMHRPMVEAALRVGANVLVEKPLAGCPADARAIVEAGDAAEIEDRRNEALPAGDPANPVMTLPGIDEPIHARADQFLARP